MKKHIPVKAILLIIPLLFALNGCPSNISVSNEAVLITVDEAINMVGYDWFKSELDDYQPDTTVIRQIENLFNPNIYKLYLYMTPSCGCVAVQKSVPHVIKALQTANISDTGFELYSIRKTTDNHPYKTLFKLERIPVAMLMKDSVPIYSILDTLEFYKKYGNQDSIPTVEKLLLEGLKK